MIETQRFPERILKKELPQYGHRRATNGSYADNLELGVIIVGAGFGGTYLVYDMCKQGYKTVLYGANLGYGGTW
jgi:ribulose 1,5-bisphosphate synthetase/thiazole synthase